MNPAVSQEMPCGQGLEREARLRWTLCAAAVIALHVLLLAKLKPQESNPLKTASEAPLAVDVAPPMEAPEKPAVPPQEPPPPKTETTPHASKPLPTIKSSPKVATPPAKQTQATAPKPRLNLTPPSPGRVPNDDAAAPLSESNPAEVENYKQVLTNYVVRHAIYPPSALALHQEGIVYIAFVIDREGRILSRHLEQSSGIAALDDEVLAIFTRPSMFPAVPPDLPSPMPLIMPFRFDLPR